MRLVPVLYILTLTLHSGWAQAPGTISGAVVDEHGKAKSGVWVTAVRATLPPARAMVSSDKNGAFVLPNLIPGDYRVCAQVPEGGYADPCQWAGMAPNPKPAVTLRQGQGVANLRIALDPAHPLQIRVNDPQGLLTAAHPERHVVVGVFSGAGLFYAAPLKSADAAGRLHQIWIPFDTPLKLSLLGKSVTLSDERGLAVSAAGATAPVSRARNGPPAVPVVYTVTGVAPR